MSFHITWSQAENPLERVLNRGFNRLKSHVGFLSNCLLMQLNPLGCVIFKKKNLSQTENLQEGVRNRGFSHHKCLYGLPKLTPPHPPKLVLGSFATLEVGCVIVQNLDSSRKPYRNGSKLGFQSSQMPCGLPKLNPTSPPTPPQLQCVHKKRHLRL